MKLNYVQMRESEANFFMRTNQKNSDTHVESLSWTFVCLFFTIVYSATGDLARISEVSFHSSDQYLFIAENLLAMKCMSLPKD